MSHNSDLDKVAATLLYFFFKFQFFCYMTLLHRNFWYGFLEPLRYEAPLYKGPISAFHNFYSFRAQDTVTPKVFSFPHFFPNYKILHPSSVVPNGGPVSPNILQYLINEHSSLLISDLFSHPARSYYILILSEKILPCTIIPFFAKTVPKPRNLFEAITT